MKRLKQHKSFIYHGDSLQYNRMTILKDLSELLEVSEQDIFCSEDVREFECKGLGVDDWDEVNENFIFNPTGKYRVIIFENADFLSEKMQNKLLKPIENCEDHIKIIFNTTRDLLGTINSRSLIVKLVSNIKNEFPKDIDELLMYFDIENIKGNEDIISSIIRLENAIVSGKSLLIESGLIKEKSKSLKFLSEKLQEVAKLILLYEIKNGMVSTRSRVARQYLEVDANESNLYLLLLELEM